MVRARTESYTLRVSLISEPAPPVYSRYKGLPGAYLRCQRLPSSRRSEKRSLSAGCEQRQQQLGVAVLFVSLSST